jgi:hypothetical protein
MSALPILAAGGCVALMLEALFIHWEKRIEQKTTYLSEVEGRALKAIAEGQCNLCRQRMSHVVHLLNEED